MTDYAYRGCFLSGKQWSIGDGVDTPILCPECIANGGAAMALRGGFVYPDALEELHLLHPGRRNAAIQELCCRTPGYAIARSPKWRVHCGDFCAYLGEQTWHELSEVIQGQLRRSYAAQPEGFQHTIEEITRGEADGKPLQVFLFRCLSCGQYLLFTTTK